MKLKSVTNYKFYRDKDDLGWFVGTHINDKEISSIVMMRHENSPILGTILYVGSSVATNDAVKRIRDILVIEDEHIVLNTPINP